MDYFEQLITDYAVDVEEIKSLGLSKEEKIKFDYNTITYEKNGSTKFIVLSGYGVYETVTEFVKASRHIVKVLEKKLDEIGVKKVVIGNNTVTKKYAIRIYMKSGRWYAVEGNYFNVGTTGIRRFDGDVVDIDEVIEMIKKCEGTENIYDCSF